MAANDDSLNKGFDSPASMGAEGSLARQGAPLPPGSAQMASTAGVPKAPLTTPKPKPATVTIRERPPPPPARAQVTIRERPQLDPQPSEAWQERDRQLTRNSRNSKELQRSFDQWQKDDENWNKQYNAWLDRHYKKPSKPVVDTGDFSPATYAKIEKELARKPATKRGKK